MTQLNPTMFRCCGLVLVVLCCHGTLAAPAVAAPKEKGRPNIVIILADDLGFSDLGCYGGEIETPCLDQLAANGLRYSQFYNTARCWTSRAALLTGKYPHQVNMAMMSGQNAPRSYSGDVPQAVKLLPQMLAPLGYRCYHSGKWHIGQPKNPTPNSPLSRGFHQSFNNLSQNSYFLKANATSSGNTDVSLPDLYLTNVITDKALQNLKEHRLAHAESPFLLYLAYTAPHFPLHALPEDVAFYRGKYREGWDVLRQRRYEKLRNNRLIQCDLSPRDPAAVPWTSLSAEQQELWDTRMAVYAGMVHRMDANIGRVIEELKSTNQLANTLILFCSDNGSSAEYIVRGGGHNPEAAPGSAETYQCLEVGWSNVANTPFREHKIWVHEGGISTPFIVHWPGVTGAPGSLCHEVSHLIDVVPTILDAAGVRDTLGELGLPGRSLLPGWGATPPRARNPLFWEHQGNRALRSGDWKIVTSNQGPWELYDLSNDRCEQKNLANIHPEIVSEMGAAWQREADAQGVVDWTTLPKGGLPNHYRMK